MSQTLVLYPRWRFLRSWWLLRTQCALRLDTSSVSHISVTLTLNYSLKVIVCIRLISPPEEVAQLLHAPYANMPLLCLCCSHVGTMKNKCVWNWNWNFHHVAVASSKQNGGGCRMIQNHLLHESHTCCNTPFKWRSKICWFWWRQPGFEGHWPVVIIRFGLFL